jgi:hypothetical protein
MITGGTIERPITDSPHHLSRLADALLQTLPVSGMIQQAKRAKPPYRWLRRRLVDVTHITEEGFGIVVQHDLRFFDV